MRSAADRVRGRLNKAIGERAEWVARRRLEAAGVRLVERIGTPWRITRAMRGGRSVIVGATPVGRVSGDYRGLLAGGRSVLVECKATDHLVWSTFEAHQRDALTAHAAAGGLSLVAWVRLQPVLACYLLEWTALCASGFGPGAGLTPEQAEAQAIRPGALAIRVGVA